MQMESKDTPSKIKDQEQSQLNNSNNKLKNSKSDFFIKKIFGYLHKKRFLEIIKYSKSIQKRIDININHYKEYSENYSSIEIEIKPIENEYDTFINIKKEDEKYFHIYYNDNKKEEIKSTSLNEKDKVSKINIVIDYQVKSFNGLFYIYDDYCCIESIYFKKFYRKNIIDMSYMFHRCSSLKELNLNNFNTNNVTNMSHMFDGCSSLKELNLNKFDTDKVIDMSFMFGKCLSLKELNLNNFNTKNVTNMSFMFDGCSSLNELNLNNFNTDNVTDMSYMFDGCSSLKELNLSNFNTNNVTSMNDMFYGCSSLKELNLNNFNTNKVIDMIYMFGKCSDELKLKIRSQFKIFKEEAFQNDED